VPIYKQTAVLASTVKQCKHLTVTVHRVALVSWY